MNILNKVTLKTLLKNRTRTIVTVIGIMLASALICGVTTFVSSFYDTLIGNTIYENGDYHRFFYNQDKTFYNEIIEDKRVDSVTYVQELGYFPVDENITFYLYILGTDGNFDEKDMAIHVFEGKYPSSPDEIMFPNLLVGEYNIGDTITIDIGERWYDGLPVEELDSEYEADKHRLEGEELRTVETRTYTVSGFYNYFVSIGSAPLSMHITMGYPVITIADEGMPDGYTYDVFVKLKNPGDALNFYEGTLYSGRNDTLLTYMGITPFDALNFTIWGIAGFVIIVVVVGSVSLIYNAFAISVAERTKQFGLLSSIGATKRQLRQSVLFEAFLVSAVGIPLGALLGIGIVVLAIQFMGDMFDTMKLAVPVTLRVSVLALVIGMGISLLTVLISAWIPSKRAMRVTAIEAIRQNKDISAKPVKTSKLTMKVLGLPGMLADKYYKRSKKRYRATVVSLFLSIVLFISTSAFADYFEEMVFYDMNLYTYDLETLVSRDLFDGSFTPDMLLEEYKAAEGVTDAAYVGYGDPLASANNGAIATFSVAIDKSYITSTAIERGRAYNEIGIYTGKESDTLATMANIFFVDDETFKELLAQYNLSEKEFMDPENPLAVVMDGHRTRERDTGRRIETRILNSDNAEITVFTYAMPGERYSMWNRRLDEEGNCYFTIFDRDADMGSDGKPEGSYEVMAEKLTMNVGKVIYDCPFFINLVESDLNIIYPISLSGNVCSQWEGMEPVYFFFLSDDHEASCEAINAINKKHDMVYTADDYAAQVAETRGAINTIQTVIFVFIGIIALISVANVFNTISTNIGLRRREFAMLRSVGMTGGGFNRMMIYESVLYGVKSLLYGLPVAAVITAIIYFVISSGFEVSFRLPWASIGIAVLSVFTAVALTMMYTLNKVKRANPIDELKNENI